MLVPSIATGSCFAADLDGIYYFVGSGGGGGGGYGITLLEKVEISYLYLLGLLNSHLLSAYLKSISTPFRGGYIALNRQYIEQLPIRTIDFSDPADVARHDRMVALVEQMLALHKQLAAAGTPHEKTGPAAAHRGHGRADRRAGLRALRADGGGDRDCGGGEQVKESDEKLFLFKKQNTDGGKE